MASRNLSIMFTDIKGFTERTSGETRNGMSELLAAHDRLLIPVFHYFKGNIVKTIGDAFLVYFESPTDAVLCGVTIQEVLRQHNIQVDDKDMLEVRVAINVGDVKLTSTDVLGEAVNIAARLEAITEPGEVYFTDAVYQTMNRHEAPSSSIGERTFKGIPHPIKIYKVIQDPGSNLAETLASGVKLSARGPIIQGIRNQLAWRKNLMLKKVGLGIILLLALAALWFLLVPSAAEKAAREAEQLLDEGQNIAAIETVHRQIIKEPGNKSLKEVALKAALRNIDELMKQSKSHEALAWLGRTVSEKPYLIDLNHEKPLIDTIVTVKNLRRQGDSGLDKPELLREFLTRYPDSPVPPYEAGRLLEEDWYPMTVLWLYRTALERGGYMDDQRIYDYCIRLLSGGQMFWPKFRAATSILDEYYQEKLLSWAWNAAREGSATSVINALNILKKNESALLNDPYYGHLANLVNGRNSGLEKDFAFFLEERDPKRREHILSLHREIIDTFPRYTSYSSVRDKRKKHMQELENKWAGP